MGDPRKQRKKYSTPRHPWEKTRLDEEASIRREYGTRNKKEIWKMDSILKNFFAAAKKAAAVTTQQGEIEKDQLFKKLHKFGLIKEGDGTDAILGLTLKQVMDRRLQTLVYKKSLSRTTKQARQFITHGHIMVGDKKITSPSYLVSIDEEPLIGFSGSSALNSVDHPERTEKKPEPVVKEEGGEAKKRPVKKKAIKKKVVKKRVKQEKKGSKKKEPNEKKTATKGDEVKKKVGAKSEGAKEEKKVEKIVEAKGDKIKEEKKAEEAKE